MASGNSYNGWPANSDPNAIGIDQSWGKKVGAPAFSEGGYPGGVKSGDVSTCFVYLVNRLHKEVEPMMTKGSNLGYGCWGYSYRANVNNPSSLSCHASGTAIDYNAPKHPNGTSTGPNGGGGWSGNQYNQIKAILNGPLQGVIKWLTSNDPMHFEIGASASKVAQVAASLGGTTPPQPSEDDLSDALDYLKSDEFLQKVADAVFDRHFEPLSTGSASSGDIIAAILNEQRSQYTGMPANVWDNHFEKVPGGGDASVGDILAAVYQNLVDLRGNLGK